MVTLMEFDAWLVETLLQSVFNRMQEANVSCLYASFSLAVEVVVGI